MDSTPPRRCVAVGLSGGVDSTVAAWLLVRQGYHVIGITMQIWDNSVELKSTTHRSGCYGPGEAEDIALAQRAADLLRIRHVTVPLAEEYKHRVLGYFRQEYLSGRTPNPCVVCNRDMKFGLLLEKSREMGLEFDYFATGHYARIRHDEKAGVHRLLKGVDPLKDQSYFLAQLDQAVLRQLIFPLGDMTKPEVVALARENGFADWADRPESQDFIESDDYSPLFKASEAQPGPMVDLNGTILGRHRGLLFYTIGQREGLGIGGGCEKLYVKELRPKDNTLVVARRDEVMAAACEIEAVRWIAEEPSPGEYEVRLRYRQKAVPCVLEKLTANRVQVRFPVSQFAITPGQAGVFYRGDEVLGGGWIAGM
ncbi:MAG: tRNA 2-thiouridine(34) synthase MnmA [Lentisphaerae bacterium GWF2_57_35]|nr:MAG: tRNA 2-thiouridine(34) synthase MnmA [Lentisphaerae bacterium GWF2_57_35]